MINQPPSVECIAVHIKHHQVLFEGHLYDKFIIQSSLTCPIHLHLHITRCRSAYFVIMIQSTSNIRKSQQSRHPVHLTSQQTCFRLGNSISIKTTIMESISCGLDSWNGTSLTFNDFANLLKRNLLSRINSSINRLLTFKCPFNRPLINIVIHPLVAISCDNVVTNELIKFLSSIDPMSQIPLSLTNLSVVCMTTKILLIIRHKNTAN